MVGPCRCTNTGFLVLPRSLAAAHLSESWKVCALMLLLLHSLSDQVEKKN
jgi:hypothetical protein